MPRAWLTPELAQELLEACRNGLAEFDCSLDLGLSRRRVPLPDGRVDVDGSILPAGQLGEVAGAKRGCFLWEDGRLEPVERAAEYFYKLIPTDEAPTIEISGIQMHRTTGTAPCRNALESARSVVGPGMRVLDTCGGLGYTAMAAARLGAAAVTSVDVDANVRALARLNPWSADYFTHPVIRLVDGDVADFVAGQSDGAFDAVIHDPPRFSRAGHLYGLAFYRELGRILRPGGKLFHYTGDPYSRGRGRSFIEGVLRRLREAGFEVRREDRLQGVTARRR